MSKEATFPNRVALVLYTMGVALFVSYLWFSGQTHGVGQGWLVYWCIASVAFALTPAVPIVGPSCFVLLAYGMSSHAAELDLMLQMKVLDVAALISLTGSWLASKLRPTHAIATPAVAVLGFMLFAWILICLIAAMMRDVPVGSFLRHHPSGFFQSASLMVGTWLAISNRRDCIALAAVIVTAVIGRGVVQGFAGMYLESYMATLCVICLPIGIAGLLIAKNWLLKFAFGALASAMLIMLIWTQNRAAAVAAVAMAVVFGWQIWHHTWSKFFIGAVVAAGALMLVVPSGYINRFQALTSLAHTSPTAALDRSTAQERLHLWAAGWDMAMAQPVFGVGPGNYPLYLDIYLPGKGQLAAHSNYVQMAAEVGFLGLGLYVASFFGSIAMLNKLRKYGNQLWQRQAAQMVQLALVAYLAGGLFNSRQDFVLAYMLLGWALALRNLHLKDVMHE